MNAEGRYELLFKEGEKVRIYKNGESFYAPGGTFAFFCDFDLSLFPFDTQTCAYKVESWRYTHQYQMFQFGGPVTFAYYTNNEQWELVRTFQKMEALSYLEPWNAFDHAEFSIVMKRKVMYYMMNVIIPSLLIAIAHLATFMLPLGEIEKINISFTCLLAYSVFQLMVVGDMPRSSDHIPLLSYYIDLQMAYIAFSLLGEGLSFIAVFNIEHRAVNGTEPPQVPKLILKVASFLSYILCLRKQIPVATRADSIDSIEKQQQVFTSKTSLQPQDSQPQQPGGVKNKRTRRRKEIKHLEVPGHEELRQMQWRLVALVIERWILVTYLFCIVATPLWLFVIYPSIVAT